MPGSDSLKRLGGGRWETRDGRFAIEPQSGTWVVVDSTQTDELGLPLVRGPFGSLTAAREAIEEIRSSGPAESPLADRLKAAKAAGNRAAKPATTRASGPPPKPPAESRPESPAEPRAESTSESPAEPASDTPPEAPAEPKWLVSLDPADRRRARELIARLDALELAEAEEIARSEIARGQPAIARFAIERALTHAVATARSPVGGARAAIQVILGGRDAELGVRWRLVDDQGRKIDDLDIPGPS